MSIHPTRAKHLHSFNRCFLLKLFVGSPFQVAFVFSPSHPLLPGAQVSFEHQFSFVRSLFRFPSIISIGEFSSRSSFFISFSLRWTQFMFFRCWSYSFPWIKCFPCLFASRHLIIPEFGRHLRRFVCVPINSRLSRHSNISIVPVHHLSFQQSFPTVFLFSGP